MKRKLSLLLAVVMLMLTVAPVMANDYNGHWAEAIIEKWIEMEKISGYPDGTFKPDNNITRAEFAKILSSVNPFSAAEYEKVEFTDVKEDDWYYESVRDLLTFEIIVKDEKFNPERELTREEAMTMAGRAFGYEIDEVANFDEILGKFKDRESISEYAVKFVAGLVSAGFVSGYEDETIRPDAKITRAECIKILDAINPVKEKYSLEGIMERIYKGTGVEYPMLGNFEITPENSEFYLGIPNMEFEEAIASETLMGSQAHSVCLVRVKEGSDVEKIKEEIRTKVDPRKWICVGVEREEVIVVNQENLILMIIDQFAPEKLRDSFMALDVKKKIKLEPDQSGLIEKDEYYMSHIGEIRTESVESFAKKVETLAKKYSASNNVYYSVIPSKSYYINDELKVPFNYDKMFEILKGGIQSAKYIDITSSLSLNDYYITDPHWRQEKLSGVVNTLGDNMGFIVSLDSYTENKYEGFKGQHGINKEDFPKETLIYLTNSHTDGAKVTHVEGSTFDKVYETDKLSTNTPYDMFLSGPSAIATVENENANSDKELVIFRDSYSCSLTPLLIENYKKITLIDLRYVVSTLLDTLVTIENCDVLFLYNDQVVNNSEMLKVIMK